MSRQEAYDFFMRKKSQKSVNSVDLRNYGFGVASLTILSIGLVSFIAGACARSAEAIVPPCTMLQIMVFGFIGAPTIQTISLIFELKSSIDLLREDYAFVNFCVDEETQFGE